ncbi:MAG TPA: deaminase [Pyrinomonadaceae bacterium]|jgi:tRNA(Arg) A34 adenosine deaminase TadA
MVDKNETLTLTVDASVAGTPVLNERLKYYLDKPVRELIALDAKPLSPGQKERHRLYSLTLMTLVHHYWNGNKYGRDGEYPWNEPADAEDGKYLNRDYLGHNIAAIAVDGDGRVIDFDFNHNKIFNSSVEHAEARLVRRVYGLAQVQDTWNMNDFSLHSPAKDDYNTLENVTVYTSLESCSQCAGIMALGRVKEIVYLQSDPDMYMIGNILHNLTLDTKLQAPLPIAASEDSLSYFNRLNSAFVRFTRQVAEKPFFIPKGGKPDHSKSITSFLCTKAARDIYGEAAAAFAEYLNDENKLEHPTFKPLDKDGQPVKTALTNRQSLAELKCFLSYAVGNGRRGTPH